MSHVSKGRTYERIAAYYLEKKGYEIVEINAQASHKEIDIIAAKDNIIHFVEVKGRANQSFGEIVETITPHKRKNLIWAAKFWIHKNYEYETDWQIDFIGIRKNGKDYKITFIEDAINEL